MSKRELNTEFCRTRCERQVLIPLLDRLDRRELLALIRFINAVKDDVRMECKREERRRGRRF